MVMWESIDAVSHQFELCQIGSTTSVALLIDEGTDPDVIELVRIAVARTGAEAAELRPLRGRNVIDRVVREVDVIVHVGEDPRAFDRSSGSSVLRLGPGIADAHRWAPTANMARRVSTVRKLLGEHSTLRVRGQHGTDLTVSLNESSRGSGSGLIKPGTSSTRAVFPSGWVGVLPEGTVDGDLVLFPGDANVGRARHIESPVRITIEDGRLTSLEGESADADLLRAQFESAVTEGSHWCTGITLGLNAAIEQPVPGFEPMLVNQQLGMICAGVVGIRFGGSGRFSGNGPVSVHLARRWVELDQLTLCDGGVLAGPAAPDVYERAH